MSKADFTKVPGRELVSKGLHDLQAGRDETPEALMVRMISTRIIDFGLPFDCTENEEPHKVRIKLYYTLSQDHADPYSAFNAYQRRLVSFCSIAERMVR